MKTAELTGAALDWAVAKCEGREFEDPESFLAYYDEGGMRYSTDWAQGGPIIEREWVEVVPWPNESDESLRWEGMQHDSPTLEAHRGPTPLIAAMRCFVASKLGNDIEIPKELTE